MYAQSDVNGSSPRSKALPHLITSLLRERQQMLVLFHRLVERQKNTSGPPLATLVQQFCQILMDYVALGHFEVYECIAECSEGNAQCQYQQQVASECHGRLTVTTQAAVDFNDRYDSAERCQDLAQLAQDLSRLGEQLAERIELEDKLIAATTGVQGAA